MQVSVYVLPLPIHSSKQELPCGAKKSMKNKVTANYFYSVCLNCEVKTPTFFTKEKTYNVHLARKCKLW